MFNSMKNIFSIKSFSRFPGNTGITKKWFIAAIFGVFICLPCFGECTPLDGPHLFAESSHSDSLFGVVCFEDLFNDLTDRQVGILLDSGLNSFKNISEIIGSFVEFISFVFGDQDTTTSNNAKEGNDNADGSHNIFGEYIAQYFPLFIGTIVVLFMLYTQQILAGRLDIQ